MLELEYTVYTHPSSPFPVMDTIGRVFVCEMLASDAELAETLQVPVV